MTNLILKVYIKWTNFLTWLRCLFRLCAFSWQVYKQDLFRKGEPKLVLVALKEFINCAWGEYSNTLVMNRTPVQSAALLNTLIESWFETGSSTRLNQILEVLKNEFIERESNGRK